jgi:hypothetical protein
MRGNYAELTRMVSEKPLAFAQGASAGGPAWLAMAAESNRYLAQAWKTPRYGLAPALSASLGAMAFWGRMMSLGVAWQSAMLAPCTPPRRPTPAAWDPRPDRNAVARSDQPAAFFP